MGGALLALDQRALRRPAFADRVRTLATACASKVSMEARAPRPRVRSVTRIPDWRRIAAQHATARALLQCVFKHCAGWRSRPPPPSAHAGDLERAQGFAKTAGRPARRRSGARDRSIARRETSPWHQQQAARSRRSTRRARTRRGRGALSGSTRYASAPARRRRAA